MSAVARIKQADLERIFRAAKAADVRVRVELEPQGKVVILPLRDGESPVADESDRWA